MLFSATYSGFCGKPWDAVEWMTELIYRSWRVAFMEQTVALLDFETVDQVVQIHGMYGLRSRRV